MPLELSVQEQQEQLHRRLNSALDILDEALANLNDYYANRVELVEGILAEPMILVDDDPKCTHCGALKGDPHLTNGCRDQARVAMIRSEVAKWMASFEASDSN